MNSSSFDPQHQFPEVSPDDHWYDPEECTAENSGSAMVLPARRVAADRSSAPSSAENSPPGLRIDSNLTRGDATDPSRRLEVQEYNGSVIRLDQVVPAPPKVARQVTFHERPVRENNAKKPRGERGEWGRAHRPPARWILGSGVAIAAIVIMGMMLLPLINASNKSRMDSEKGVLSVVAEEKIEGMEAMNLLLLKQPEALQIFRGYAQASHVDEIIPLVRDAAALKETLRGHWRPLGFSQQWAPSTESTWSVLELAGHPCGLLEGTFPDHSKFSAYFTHQGGRLLLDWKATTAFGAVSFKQLENSRGDGGEIRGHISIADFYSSVWPETEYQCYRLVSPDGETAIWCYARRGEAAEEVIAGVFYKGEIVGEVQSSQKIALRLERGPAGAQPNQWLIGAMLHIDWVSP